MMGKCSLLIFSAIALCGQVCGPIPACVCIGCIDFNATSAPAGFQTLQYGPKLSYTLSGLTPGLYQLKLTWWDPSYAKAGLRGMSLSVNDFQMASNLDVAAMGGGMSSPNVVNRALMVPVIDGTMTVNLAATRLGTNAILSKLTVTPVIAVQPSAALQVWGAPLEKHGTVYVLATAPVGALTDFRVYRNGLRLMLGADYTMDSTFAITPLIPWADDDTIQADYSR